METMLPEGYLEGLEKWLHATFNEKNSIERLFETPKERTKGVYNNIN